MKRIIALIFLLVLVGGFQWLIWLDVERNTRSISLDVPTPALGKTIASALHQALTDPYFEPLERLADYLQNNPQTSGLSVDLLTKWGSDTEFPTCFVWNPSSSGIQIDQATSPWVLELVVERLREGMKQSNPKGLLHISSFKYDNSRYWLGFMRIPLGSDRPQQMAGVFFSIDRYLEQDVPRLIDHLVERKRFPLVDFENTSPSARFDPNRKIAFRIMDDHDRVYLQRGTTFDPNKMIYAESQYYDKNSRIVCLQTGWDLQVFSADAVKPQKPTLGKVKFWGLAVVQLILLVMIFWWGSSHKKVNTESILSKK